MKPKRRESSDRTQLLTVSIPHCITSSRPQKNVRRNQPTEGHVGLTEANGGRDGHGWARLGSI